MKNIVLMIENDQDTVAKASGALEGAGYNIVSAGTAQEGTEKANELIPVLIMINLATPGANGLELCKSLHNTDALTEVPIILLTLREGKFEPVYTKLYGIVSFLKKPFDNDELLALAQEHAPVAEAEESVEDEATMEMDAGGGEDEFGTMEMDSGEMDSGSDEGVFSIDETEQSLDDLQASFQTSLDDEAGTPDDTPSDKSADMSVDMSADVPADMPTDMDDAFEGTQQFSLEDTGEMDSASTGENAGENAGEEAAEEAGGGDWGEMDSGDAGEEAGGGDWDETDSGDATPDDEGLDDADSTLKMDLASSGWGEMDIDDSDATTQTDSTEGTSGAEDADSGFDVKDTTSESPDEDDFGSMGGDMEDTFGSDDTMQMDVQDSTGETEEPMSDDTPSFDDEPMGDDETFMDDSMAGDDDLPQMDLEDEDYSELFSDSDEDAEDTGKGKKKKKKKAKKKKDKKAGGKSSIKRILVLVLLLLVLGGGGFAAYTFFLVEEPAPTITVTRQPARPSTPSPDMSEEPPADLLKELEEEQALAEPEPKVETPAPKPEPRKETAKPKRTPAPAPAASTQMASKGAYYVQFGVFGVKANAERMAFKIEKKGLEPLIQPKKSGGKTINYVLLDEPFSSWGKASKKASQVKSSTGLDTAVYKIK